MERAVALADAHEAADSGAGGVAAVRVTEAEVDPRQHDTYLGVIISHSPQLGDAMRSMGETAGQAARSRSRSDFAAAVASMQLAGDRALALLDALAPSVCPTYLRGADGQLQDALKLQVDGAQRGVRAATSGDGAALAAAAEEMEVANQDIVAAAERITAWRSGAARA